MHALKVFIVVLFVLLCVPRTVHAGDKALLVKCQNTLYNIVNNQEFCEKGR